MGASGELATITNGLAHLQFGDDLTDRDAVEAMRSIVLARNLIDHHAAVVVELLDRLGVANRQGRSTRELLIAMGIPPSAASRMMRIAATAAAMPTVVRHAADGSVSGEHVDAVARGITHISRRSSEAIDEQTGRSHVTDLLAQVFSGATPAQVMDRARTIGNQLAAETVGGLPAAEDRSLNTLDHTKNDDGRLQVRADLDAEVGEKLCAAIEELSAPRPEPDGSPDSRSAARRRADALEALLDLAARAGQSAASPRIQVVLTIPADAPTLASLEFMGSVTERTAHALACDMTVTPIIIDAERVPVDIGREKRLFPAHLRKALYVRDRTCIKCGAPASRTHAHHIRHWVDGGETSLANGCLLCPSCHADVHHNGWDVTMGADGHPWLVPPITVDSKRQPVPAHNRRSLTIANMLVAA